MQITAAPAIEPTAYYTPDAPEMRAVAAVQTLNRWRCEGRGPAYVRAGSRIRYRGEDVLAWLDARRVRTDDAA